MGFARHSVQSRDLQLVIDNMSCSLVVERVDDLVVPITVHRCQPESVYNRLSRIKSSSHPLFIPIEVSSLSTVPRAIVQPIAQTSANQVLDSPQNPYHHSLMEEQRIVRLRIIDQPPHRSNHILPSRDLPRVPRIIREEDNVVLLVTESFTQEPHEVLGIVDTASKFLRGTDVVDSDLASKRMAHHCQSRLTIASSRGLTQRAFFFPVPRIALSDRSASYPLFLS